MRGLIRSLVPAAAIALSLVLPATGQAAGAPAISWSPSTSGGFDYGAVTPGQTASQTFTLTNSGGSATGMLTVALSGSATFTKTADACTGTAIGKGKSCAVTVQFAPATAGASYNATLTATGKKPPASASITLTGSGAGTEDLTLSPGRFVTTTNSGTKLYDYDFGMVASATQTFTVTNNGTGASNMLIVVFGGDTGFSFGNDTCTGNALAPSGTCSFDLTFTAPAGCNPGDPFPEHVDAGFQDNGTPYIHLEARGSCP